MAAPDMAPYAHDTPGLKPNRACRHCVQIKAKCIPLDESNNMICQRCHRLGKECTTPAPVPRKRHRIKSTRVSQLEEKINTLTDLLTTTGKAIGSNTASQPDPVDQGPDDNPDQRQSSLPTPPVSTSTETRHVCEPANDILLSLRCDRSFGSGKRSETASTTAYAENFPSFQMAPVLEERLFSDFRTEMNRHFPFVIVPPQATTAAFREEKPFLFRVCIAAACHVDPALQRQMGEDLMKYVGDRMLLKGEKSLDLLQGILVFTAWYQYYNQTNPQLMNLLHLALAMATDLGLTRPTHIGKWPPLGVAIDTTLYIHGKPISQGLQTSDERRALLGVYHFGGQLSTCFRGLNLIRWSQHLEDCCTALSAAAEYPSDTLLLQLVELDRVAERYSPILGAQSIAGMPILSYINCFEEDLRRYQRNLPPVLADNDFMQLNVLSALVCLYEPILSTEHDNTIHKVSALHGCLAHIGRFLETFLTLSVADCPRFPFMLWIQMAQVIMMLSRLSFLVVEGWDLNYIRNSSMNFSSVAERMIQMMEGVAQQDNQKTAPSNGLSAKYLLYADKMRLCKKWYDSKVKAETESAASTTDATAGLSAYDVPLEALFEGLDSNIWAEFPADWTIPMQI